MTKIPALVQVADVNDNDPVIQLFVNSAKLEAVLLNDYDWLSNSAIRDLMDRKRVALDGGWMEVRDIEVFSF